MSHKILDNDLVTICKNKVKLRLTNLYTLECVLELSKALMHEFHYDYIKNKMVTQDFYSQTLTLNVWN